MKCWLNGVLHKAQHLILLFYWTPVFIVTLSAWKYLFILIKQICTSAKHQRPAIYRPRIPYHNIPNTIFVFSTTSLTQMSHYSLRQQSTNVCRIRWHSIQIKIYRLPSVFVQRHIKTAQPRFSRFLLFYFWG